MGTANILPCQHLYLHQHSQVSGHLTKIGSSIEVGGAWSTNKDYMVASYIPNPPKILLSGEPGASPRSRFSPPPWDSRSMGTSGGVAFHPNQQSISCPNCKKRFSYVRGQNDAFGPWFEHIKFSSLYHIASGPCCSAASCACATFISQAVVCAVAILLTDIVAFQFLICYCDSTVCAIF